MKERIISVGSVRAAGGVQEKGDRSSAVLKLPVVLLSRAAKPMAVSLAPVVRVEERIITLCGIATRVASVWCWDDGLHHWR